MLRRAESRGTIPLPKLLKLAAAINCGLHLEKRNEQPAADLQTSSLNQRHPGLVWSNSDAPKEVYIRKALLNPRFGHRRSGALDFAFLSDRLPKTAINLLRRKFPNWVRNDNLASYDEFLIAGQSLHDYQQDFVSGDGVKVTFLAEDRPHWAVFGIPPAQAAPLRVATTKEIFALKCLVSARRSKSRDWFDLYVLFREHGFEIADMIEAFGRANQSAEIDVALRRLSSGITAPDDEG
jgi:hypothetical protein